MNLAQTLPARAYLLAYDLHKQRLTDKAWLDYVVQGAALAQLLAGGQLHDPGTAVVATDSARPSDEVLDLVLNRVQQADRRDWRALLHQSKATLEAVQDQLIRTGVVARRGRRVVVLDPAAVAELQAKARQVLGDGDVAGVDPLDAALVALASVVPLRTVFQRRRGRHDRERVDDLVRRVSADVPGFERLIRQMRHTRGRAYSAGGPVH
jgi:Golgi phosphoprotein 3 (GPP34)